MVTHSLGISAFFLVALLPGVLSLFLLVTALNVLLRSAAGRYFLFLCLCITFWSLGYALTFRASSAESALTWMNVSTASLLLLPSLCYLFNDALLNSRKPPAPLTMLLVGIAAVLESLHLGIRCFVTDAVPHPWGYFPRYGWPFLGFAAFFLVVIARILFEAWHAYRRAPLGAVRSRNRLLLITWAGAFLGTQDILIGFGIPTLPLGGTAVSCFILVSFILISRYGLPDFFQNLGLSSILRFTTDAILLVDTAGVLRNMDMETSRKLDCDDPHRLSGRHVNSLFAAGTPLFTPGRLQNLLEGVTVPPLLLELSTPTGATIPTRFRISGVYNDVGELLGIVAIGRDVREEIQKEQELVRANRSLQEKVVEVEERTQQLENANRALESNRAAMLNILEDMEESHARLEDAYRRLEELDRTKDAFLSSVSHELRTPLTSIRSFSEILLAYPQEERETQQEFLGIIHQESERLTRLVNDLLDLAKIQSGKTHWQQDRVDVAALFRSAARSFSVLSEEKRLNISSEVEPGFPPLYADRDKIYQVVCNLVTNAIKFTPDGGSVQLQAVRCTAGENGSGQLPFVKIQVADTGPGIPEDELGHIFEKFHQCGDTVTAKPQGTGLGLSICREIVQHYGGRIWAESERGRGTVLSFTLPVRSPPPSGEPCSDAGRSAENPQAAEPSTGPPGKSKPSAG